MPSKERTDRALRVPIREQFVALRRFIEFIYDLQRRAVMATKLNTTEARQGTRPRAMLWVLLTSIGLCIVAGLLLAVGWISVPWSP